MVENKFSEKELFVYLFWQCSRSWTKRGQFLSRSFCLFRFIATTKVITDITNVFFIIMFVLVNLNWCFKSFFFQILCPHISKIIRYKRLIILSILSLFYDQLAISNMFFYSAKNECINISEIYSFWGIFCHLIALI